MRYCLQIIFIGLFIIFISASCSKGNSEVRKFAGSYSGTYSGDASGTWTAEFKNNGSVTATVIDPEIGTFKGLGSIKPNGEFSFSTSGAGLKEVSVITWEGKFTIEGDTVTGSGTWKSSTGVGGTWEGKRQ